MGLPPNRCLLSIWLKVTGKRQDNITTLLDLLDAREFYPRLYSLQFISHICAARPERTQECILTAPLGISRVAGMLADVREPVRNGMLWLWLALPWLLLEMLVILLTSIVCYTEALLLLIALTPSSEEIQKLVAFENAFELVLSLIEQEGSLTHGSEVVEDCLSLLANLLRLNAPNQSYFRETGCVKELARILSQTNDEQENDEPIPQWILAHRDKNLWGVLAILQLFLVKGGVSTPANQLAFWKNGVTQQVLRTAFSQHFSVKVTSKVCSILSIAIMLELIYV